MDRWLLFWQIFYPLVIIGLMVDRYWLEEERLVKRMIDKCKETGRCRLCKRPMTIVEDEHVHQ